MCALRYPGGKTRAIKYLEQYIPKNIIEVYSPFFGGGSFELHLNKKGIKVYANDKFEPLYTFWKCLKEDKTKLIEEITKLRPINKLMFLEYRSKILKTPSESSLRSGLVPEEFLDITINEYIRAAYYFAINRSSFSGATLSGGFSKESGEKRFTKSSIEKLKKINLETIEFKNLDYKEFIRDIPPTLEGQTLEGDILIFLDPPYYLGKKSKLYGNKGDLHEDFDHMGLYEMLNDRKEKNNWILCYNDCEYITDLYKDYEIIKVNWKYGMNSSKKSSEILIINDIKKEEPNIIFSDDPPPSINLSKDELII